jgi:hypothetical protein
MSDLNIQNFQASEASLAALAMMNEAMPQAAAAATTSQGTENTTSNTSIYCAVEALWMSMEMLRSINSTSSPTDKEFAWDAFAKAVTNFGALYNNLPSSEQTGASQQLYNALFENTLPDGSTIGELCQNVVNDPSSSSALSALEQACTVSTMYSVFGDVMNWISEDGSTYGKDLSPTYGNSTIEQYIQELYSELQAGVGNPGAAGTAYALIYDLNQALEQEPNLGPLCSYIEMILNDPIFVGSNGDSYSLAEIAGYYDPQSPTFIDNPTSTEKTQATDALKDAAPFLEHVLSFGQ